MYFKKKISFFSKDKNIHIDIHSSLVKFLKLILPSLAGLLVCVVMIWPQLREEQNLVAKNINNIKMADVEAMTIVLPVFQSIDKKDNPFNVTAKKAFEKSDAIILLDEPKGDITLDNSNLIFFQANNGEYDRNKGFIFFTGDVSMFSDDGYSLLTDKVNLNIETKEIRSFAPVIITGENKEITGNSLLIKNNGKNIIVNGNIKAKIKDTKNAF